jgi:agmatine deiminase
MLRNNYTGLDVVVVQIQFEVPRLSNSTILRTGLSMPHSSITSTPKQDGFRMPAEWALHERSWMMWPCRTVVWPDMAATRKDFTAVAHAIREFEPLTMTVNPKDEAEARSMLGSDIDIAVTPLDDSWARDAGPCFLVDSQGNRAGVNFNFNAWGGKYDPFDKDDAFSGFVLSQSGVRQYNSRLIAEGGGLSVDGEGTILTTESCFPNSNRNPDWSRTEIENELLDMLGGDKVIWLPGNVEETETDGHVDGIAVFVRPGVVLIENAGDPGDPFYDIMKANIAALENQGDAKGRSIELITIPEAYDAVACGDKFCRSYVNSYLVNGGVIMPCYGVATDDEARDAWQELFPERRIVQVSINNIALGGGGIHCITQQEAAA